uniref:Uncharacterized protein n=1 Tax=Moniliophthora roreri TaxID=221103 RepID=A0A0W0G6N9_MONRR
MSELNVAHDPSTESQVIRTRSSGRIPSDCNPRKAECALDNDDPSGWIRIRPEPDPLGALVLSLGGLIGRRTLDADFGGGYQFAIRWTAWKELAWVSRFQSEPLVRRKGIGLGQTSGSGRLNYGVHWSHSLPYRFESRSPILTSYRRDPARYAAILSNAGSWAQVILCSAGYHDTIAFISEDVKRGTLG